MIGSPKVFRQSGYTFAIGNQRDASMVKNYNKHRRRQK